MTDTKYVFGAKLVVAMALSMISYALLTPVINIYAAVVGQGYSCPSSGGEMCLIMQPVVTLLIPIAAIFFIIFSIFEVFIK